MKARWKGHKELDPFESADLDDGAHENRETLHQDSFWADQMERALNYPGERDTPVNFRLETSYGKMAISYRIASPMAWEYPTHLVRHKSPYRIAW